VLSYRVILHVPLPLVLFVSGLLVVHRLEIAPSTMYWSRSGARATSRRSSPPNALGALMVLEGDVICLLPRIMAAHLAERGP